MYRTVELVTSAKQDVALSVTVTFACWRETNGQLKYRNQSTGFGS